MSLSSWISLGVFGLGHDIPMVCTQVRDSDDLASPLCGHIREGDWLVDWSVNRCVAHRTLVPFCTYLRIHSLIACG